MRLLAYSPNPLGKYQDKGDPVLLFDAEAVDRHVTALFDLGP